MIQQTQNQSNPDTEVSLKEVILKIRDWTKYLLHKWKIIVLAGILGAGLGFTYAFFQKANYVAEITFVLEESKTNPLGAYAGLASQFGLDMGGSGSGIFSGENILEFLRSRLMVEKTLLSPAPAASKNISLADSYINMYSLKEKWAKDPALKGISFPANMPRYKFTLIQDSVLNSIYRDIVKYNLFIAKPNKKLSFISVKCLSRDQVFSKVFSERLVKEATDFYVETKIKRSKTNVDKLQQKADSIELLLNRKTFSVAEVQDLNLNPARNVARVGLEVGTRDKMVLQTMYGEVVKNLEISKMSMAQETPIIQIVDTPILPLEKQKFGKLKGLILGGLLFGFVIVIFLIVKRLYVDIMK